MFPLSDDNDIRNAVGNNPHLQAIMSSTERCDDISPDERWDLYLESTPTSLKESPVSEKTEAVDNVNTPNESEAIWEEVTDPVPRGSEQGTMFDSLPRPVLPALEVEGRTTVTIEVNQAEGRVVARFAGRELVERNPGDWFVERALQVDAVALTLAWKTKYKDVPLPATFQTSLSIQGGFSMGGNRLSLLAPTWRQKRQVGKHATGQKKKAKRRK